MAGLEAIEDRAGTQAEQGTELAGCQKRLRHGRLGRVRAWLVRGVRPSDFFLPTDDLTPVSCGGRQTIDAGTLLDAAVPYESNRQHTDRVVEIVGKLPSDLINAAEHRVRRTTHERVGAAMTDVFGADVDKSIEDLKRVAKGLERVRNLAIIDTVDSERKEH